MSFSELRLDASTRCPEPTYSRVLPTVRDREEKREQQAQTERTIRGQKLTPLEIQNLSTERSALSRQMQDIQQRYRTAVSRTMNLEIDLNKRIDEATALAARYEEKAQPLGLLNGPLDGYEEVPFAQEINGASDNPVPEGLGTVVKPALSKLRQKTRDEIRDVNMTDFRIESELTKLKEILADLREKETVQVQELDVVDHEKGQMQEVRASFFFVLAYLRFLITCATVAGYGPRACHDRSRARTAAEPGPRRPSHDE